MCLFASESIYFSDKHSRVSGVMCAKLQIKKIDHKKCYVMMTRGKYYCSDGSLS